MRLIDPPTPIMDSIRLGAVFGIPPAVVRVYESADPTTRRLALMRTSVGLRARQRQNRKRRTR